MSLEKLILTAGALVAMALMAGCSSDGARGGREQKLQHEIATDLRLQVDSGAVRKVKCVEKADGERARCIATMGVLGTAVKVGIDVTFSADDEHYSWVMARL